MQDVARGRYHGNMLDGCMHARLHARTDRQHKNIMAPAMPNGDIIKLESVAEPSVRPPFASM